MAQAKAPVRSLHLTRLPTDAAVSVSHIGTIDEEPAALEVLQAGEEEDGEKSPPTSPSNTSVVDFGEVDTLRDEPRSRRASITSEVADEFGSRLTGACDDQEPISRRGSLGADDRDILGAAVGRLLSAPAAVGQGRGTPARSVPQDWLDEAPEGVDPQDYPRYVGSLPELPESPTSFKVRNTFIEVAEVSSSRAAAESTRCVSEPMHLLRVRSSVEPLQGAPGLAGSEASTGAEDCRSCTPDLASDPQTRSKSEPGPLPRARRAAETGEPLSVEFVQQAASWEAATGGGLQTVGTWMRRQALAASVLQAATKEARAAGAAGGGPLPAGAHGAARASLRQSSMTIVEGEREGQPDAESERGAEGDVMTPPKTNSDPTPKSLSDEAGRRINSGFLKSGLGVYEGSDVQIRNTFIEVQEAAEPASAVPSTRSGPGARSGHLRCASEPMHADPSLGAPRRRRRSSGSGGAGALAAAAVAHSGSQKSQKSQHSSRSSQQESHVMHQATHESTGSRVTSATPVTYQSTEDSFMSRNVDPLRDSRDSVGMSVSQQVTWDTLRDSRGSDAPSVRRQVTYMPTGSSLGTQRMASELPVGHEASDLPVGYQPTLDFSRHASEVPVGYFPTEDSFDHYRSIGPRSFDHVATEDPFEARRSLDGPRGAAWRAGGPPGDLGLHGGLFAHSASADTPYDLRHLSNGSSAPTAHVHTDDSLLFAAPKRGMGDAGPPPAPGATGGVAGLGAPGLWQTPPGTRPGAAGGQACPPPAVPVPPLGAAGAPPLDPQTAQLQHQLLLQQQALLQQQLQQQQQLLLQQQAQLHHHVQLQHQVHMQQLQLQQSARLLHHQRPPLVQVPQQQMPMQDASTAAGGRAPPRGPPAAEPNAADAAALLGAGCCGPPAPATPPPWAPTRDASRPAPGPRAENREARRARLGEAGLAGGPPPSAPAATGPAAATAAAPAKAASQASSRTRPPTACKWYLKGTCKFGDDCRYSHRGPAAPKATEGAAEDETPAGPVAPSAPEQATAQEAPAAAVREAAPEPGDEDAGGDGDPKAPCQVIWCDQRAFKSDSNALRAELDGATQVQAKAHKTAEKCIRLLQKKRRAREKTEARPLSVFLVSWANAPELVEYLAGAPHVAARVVVLCDMCGARARDAAERWASELPAVAKVAMTWHEGVAAAAAAVRSIALGADALAQAPSAEKTDGGAVLAAVAAGE